MNALIAAYREGLAFAAIAVIDRAGSLRIAALCQDDKLADGETIVARWWCRRAAEAECVAGSAARSFRRRRQKSAETSRDEPALACDLVARAAQRLAVALRSDADLDLEAAHAIARLDAEIAAQMRSGALKSLNRSYKQYRLEASGRGERSLSYAKWMDGYKLKLMREIAANLRQR